jgi:hypothetical protein
MTTRWEGGDMEETEAREARQAMEMRRGGRL